MREIYDIVTKKNINIPDRKLMSVCEEIGADYTAVSRLTKGVSLHAHARYILPANKNKIITFIDFNTEEEFDCICDSSLSYYLRRPLTQNEVKYLYGLRKGRQKLSSVAGRILALKGSQKENRFHTNMKAGGDSFNQKVLAQKLRYKIASRLRCRIYKAIKNKTNTSQELIGCNYDFLMGYLEKQFTNGMSWDNYGEWHIDHRKPCASFDLSSPEQQKLCCHYTNLQPLWAKDNLSKGDKL
jgi:hypothetical protein